MRENSKKVFTTYRNIHAPNVMGEYVFFEVIGSPSTFKLICRVAELVRVIPTFSFRVTENVDRG